MTAVTEHVDQKERPDWLSLCFLPDAAAAAAGVVVAVVAVAVVVGVSDDVTREPISVVPLGYHYCLSVLFAVDVDEDSFFFFFFFFVSEEKKNKENKLMWIEWDGVGSRLPSLTGPSASIFAHCNRRRWRGCGQLPRTVTQRPNRNPKKNKKQSHNTAQQKKKEESHTDIKLGKNKGKHNQQGMRAAAAAVSAVATGPGQRLGKTQPSKTQ